MHCTFWPTLLMPTLTKWIWWNYLLHFWQPRQSIIKSLFPLKSASSPSWSGSFLPHIEHIVFSLTPLSSTLSFSCLSDFLHGKFFLTSEKCLAWNLSTQLCVKWILKPSLQVSSDLSKMALLWVALSIYVFHNLLCISTIGPFPSWRFLSLRSGASLAFSATFFFLLSSFQT